MDYKYDYFREEMHKATDLQNLFGSLKTFLPRILKRKREGMSERGRG